MRCHVYYARKNSTDKNGYSPIGHNRTWTKLVFNQINHFQCILYTLTIHINWVSYIQCILEMLYTHFYAKKYFLWAILYMSMAADVFSLSRPLKLLSDQRMTLNGAKKKHFRRLTQQSETSLEILLYIFLNLKVSA